MNDTPSRQLLLDHMIASAINGVFAQRTRTVASLLGLSRQTIDHQLARMVGTGVIEHIQRGSGTESGQYRVVLDALPPAAPRLGPAPTWTPERDAEIMRLRGTGLTAAKIADELGLTKGMVCGRLDRIKGRREERDRSYGRRAPVPVVPRPVVVRVVPVAPPVVIVAPVAVVPPAEAPPPFSDRIYRPVAVYAPMPIPHARLCQFPMWGNDERPTHVYCDQPIERGSYCNACASVSYTRQWRGALAA